MAVYYLEWKHCKNVITGMDILVQHLLVNYMVCVPLFIFECAGLNSVYCILTPIRKKERNNKRSSQ